MSTELTMKTENILKDIQKAYLDIPFENSDYQNITFVIKSQQTPARAYRAIGLRMFSKIQAIKDLKYSRQLEDVDIAEKRELLLGQPSRFDKKRAEIEIAKLLDVRPYTDKLLGDALHELDTLYHEYEKFPKYTREAFEAEEAEHFKKRLELQLSTNNNGAFRSLQAMSDPDVEGMLALSADEEECHTNPL